MSGKKKNISNRRAWGVGGAGFTIRDYKSVSCFYSVTLMKNALAEHILQPFWDSG